MPPSPATPRPPRKVDSAYLERAALYYLERFASSAANLERVLKRKIDRRCKLRGEVPSPFYDLIPPLIARYLASGLLNDTVYAQGQVGSLRRRGGSARMIAAKLKAKGVAATEVESALHAQEIDELQAARNYARRRRLGAWRSTPMPDRRDKDLAAMARAGFSYQLARLALAKEDESQ